MPLQTYSGSETLYTMVPRFLYIVFNIMLYRDRCAGMYSALYRGARIIMRMPALVRDVQTSSYGQDGFFHFFFLCLNKFLLFTMILPLFRAPGLLRVREIRLFGTVARNVYTQFFFFS